MGSVIFAAGLIAVVSTTTEACDHLSRHFYKEIGCSPVYSGDPLCPSSFDCGLLEVNRRNYCVIGGQVFVKGSKVEYGSGISSPCVPGCYCYQNYDQSLTRTKWQCTHIDCAHYFRPNTYQPGCYWQEESKVCCPFRKVCKKTLHKCSYNGVKYNENDRFYTFKDASCMKCICKQSFNGTISEPWCNEISCDLELHDGEQLAKGCVPIYSKHFCCPIDWRCPDPEDTIQKLDSPSDTKKAAEQCRFGNLTLDVGDILQPDLEANCRCNIPPYLVCTSV